MKIDVEKLAREAMTMARRQCRDMPIGTISDAVAFADALDLAYKQNFARLVMEECANICEHLSTRAGTADECAEAIRARMP